MPTVYVIVTTVTEGCKLNEQPQVERMAGGAVRRLSVQLTPPVQRRLIDQLDSANPEQLIESVREYSGRVRRRLTRSFWQYRQYFGRDRRNNTDLFLVIDGRRIPNEVEFAFQNEGLIYTVNTVHWHRNNQISISFRQANPNSANGRLGIDPEIVDPINALFQTGPIVAYARQNGTHWQPVTKQSAKRTPTEQTTTS